jgi:hypothetical protein
MPLPTLFYRGSFIGGGNRKKTTDLSQFTDKLFYIMLYWVSVIQIHNVNGDRHWLYRQKLRFSRRWNSFSMSLPNIQKYMQKKRDLRDWQFWSE